ncbi:hypothetical protein KKG83_06025 [Candidatus Micrarchaeota archaeon]|nr:hypothetical protein [Candidatus Micrarchaeota archaeon]
MPVAKKPGNSGKMRRAFNAVKRSPKTFGKAVSAKYKGDLTPGQMKRAIRYAELHPELALKGIRKNRFNRFYMAPVAIIDAKGNVKGFIKSGRNYYHTKISDPNIYYNAKGERIKTVDKVRALLFWKSKERVVKYERPRRMLPGRKVTSDITK